MQYKEFFCLLSRNGLINPVWRFILDIIDKAIDTIDAKDDYLNLFAIYFSLIDDGNVGMSLDEKALSDKWHLKLNGEEILLSEAGRLNEAEYAQIRDESHRCIGNSLANISAVSLPQVIGEKKIFDIEDGWLYLRKYNIARKGIKESVKRLFSVEYTKRSSFSCKDVFCDKFELTSGQSKAVEQGFNSNLIITGGPGTGKTTSILFLLLNLLSEDTGYEIYLTAPSGKAASRMQESIVGGINASINNEYIEKFKTEIGIISNLKGCTIHSLLGTNYESGSFKHNKEHKFNEKSIFVIDEASMIDICLFNSLLQAIPDKARVFIMGDKNQLPSVECGAVFGELLEMKDLKSNIIELDESRRFGKDTKIFALAEAINNNSDLPVIEKDWVDYKQFQITTENNQIYYYKDQAEKTKDEDIIGKVVKSWGDAYYKDLQTMATDLDETDKDSLKALFEKSNHSRILTAENEGSRGIHAINRIIKKRCIDEKKMTSVNGFYPGQLMMVTKNNKALDLNNGESGVLVTFKDDTTLYFMVEKSSVVVTEDGKQEDKIFKIGKYIFYPFRMISLSDIVMSYAITIHKSQGSDYDNIFVILPKQKGHPLLNRQIVYTAITRTKGSTYILSNQDRFNEAKENIIRRDTNIA